MVQQYWLFLLHGHALHRLRFITQTMHGHRYLYRPRATARKNIIINTKSANTLGKGEISWTSRTFTWPPDTHKMLVTWYAVVRYGCSLCFIYYFLFLVPRCLYKARRSRLPIAYHSPDETQFLLKTPLLKALVFYLFFNEYHNNFTKVTPSCQSRGRKISLDSKIV